MWHWLTRTLIPIITFSRPLEPDASVLGQAPSEMLVPRDLWTLSGSQAQVLLQRGIITVEEYARSLFSRIDERDLVVKAWTYLGLSPLWSSCQPGLTLLAKIVKMFLIKHERWIGFRNVRGDRCTGSPSVSRTL